MAVNEHQLKIAKRTLLLSESGARIMGGMDHPGAIATLRRDGWSGNRIANALRRGGHREEDISRWSLISLDR